MAPSQELDEILINLCQQGLSRVQILECLNMETIHTMELQTLAPHLQCLKLSTLQPQLTEQEKDNCLFLMKLHHTRRWQQNEAVRIIQNQYKMPLFSMTMLQFLLKKSGLNWCSDDIELCIVSAQHQLTNYFSISKLVMRMLVSDKWLMSWPLLN
ncbi:hypothetical protein DFH28DRAFT_923779 [Melampsora americana]|nr:hypothetical protein DFH28DRAFT_923779 [Melampsora americana]